MNHSSNEIVHIEVIDKREVGLKSPNMEKLGLIRSLRYLKSQSIGINEVVTDASNVLKATMRELHMYVVHLYGEILCR